MNIRTAAVLGAAVMVVGQPIVAQPSVDDYEHAIGLRSSWSGLTENIAEPAQWIEGTHRFVYRKTVPGGFQFVIMDAETKQKQPAFDHDRLAAALGTATGKVSSGLHLPFTEPFTSVEISDGGRALTTTARRGLLEMLIDRLCLFTAAAAWRAPASRLRDGARPEDPGGQFPEEVAGRSLAGLCPELEYRRARLLRRRGDSAELRWLGG